MDEYVKREDALKIIDNYSKAVTEEGMVVVNAIRDIIAVITPTADVVPKSVVAILTAQNMAFEIAKNDLQHRLNIYIGVENILKDNMGELIKAAINGAKQEVAREIFEEIIAAIFYKIPPKIRPIFRSDGRNFDDGYRDGKTDAFVEVLMLIDKLKKKYTEGDE